MHISSMPNKSIAKMRAKQVVSIFKCIDRDGDGSLSKEEFLRGLQELPRLADWCHPLPILSPCVSVPALQPCFHIEMTIQRPLRRPDFGLPEIGQAGGVFAPAEALCT